MTNVLWTIFEILVNYYQGFIEIIFLKTVLKPKPNTDQRFGVLLFSFIIGTIITVFNQFTIFEGIGGIIVYWMCSFCYCLHGNAKGHKHADRV